MSQLFRLVCLIRWLWRGCARFEDTHHPVRWGFVGRALSRGCVCALICGQGRGLRPGRGRRGRAHPGRLSRHSMVLHGCGRGGWWRGLCAGLRDGRGGLLLDQAFGGRPASPFLHGLQPWQVEPRLALFLRGGGGRSRSRGGGGAGGLLRAGLAGGRGPRLSLLEARQWLAALRAEAAGRPVCSSAVRAGCVHVIPDRAGRSPATHAGWWQWPRRIRQGRWPACPPERGSQAASFWPPRRYRGAGWR